MVMGKSSCWLRIISLLLPAFSAQFMSGSAPDWLRAAATVKLPPDLDAPAVIVLNEESLTATEKGEVTLVRRRACRIVRAQGREFATFGVPFDVDTRINSISAWSISPNGRELEVKAKDAVETTYSAGTLYSDARLKAIVIPGADPGSTVGYEYSQKQRPNLLEEIFSLSDGAPVLRSRVMVQIPSAWEMRPHWRNHPVVAPTIDGPGRWTWEVKDLPALQAEPYMPSRSAVAPRLAVNLIPPRTAGLTSSGWKEIGLWYHHLAQARRSVTPEIRQKVAEIAGEKSGQIDRIRMLSEFVQQRIRYVAIEIGIGGYQPHFAGEVLAGGYGDCKDKATLLASMLGETGTNAYYVLLNATRGVVDESFPTTRLFNHAILAIELSPEQARKFEAGTVVVERGLVLFDPTDSMTPFGALRPDLQAGTGLLILDAGGEVIQLPTATPKANRVECTGKVRLQADGVLTGEIREVSFGSAAAALRGMFRDVPNIDRAREIERYIAPHMQATLRGASLENMGQLEQPFGVHFEFTAPNYAQKAGDLILVRPRVLGHKSIHIPVAQRKYAVEFPTLTQETDDWRSHYLTDTARPSSRLRFRWTSRSAATAAGQRFPVIRSGTGGLIPSGSYAFLRNR
jgi:hypothetical protein